MGTGHKYSFSSLSFLFFFFLCTVFNPFISHDLGISLSTSQTPLKKKKERKETASDLGGNWRGGSVVTWKVTITYNFSSARSNASSVLFRHPSYMWCTCIGTCRHI